MSYTLFKTSWKNLIFERRNKEYGAYVLRTEYDNYILLALLAAVLLAGVSIGGPTLYEKFFGDKFAVEEMKEVVLTDVLPPPPPENPNEPPPPVELPKVETIKFLPPEVKKDEEVVEPPPTIEEVKEAVISNKTEEGVKGDETTVVVEEAPPAPIEEPKEEEVLVYAEQMPEFPGGQAEMFKFFAKNINYPREAANMGIEGRVALSLEVDKDGNLAKITVEKSLGYGCDEEAVRVAKLMPKWNPGKMNGRSVKVKVRVPIKFQLSK